MWLNCVEKKEDHKGAWGKLEDYLAWQPTFLFFFKVQNFSHCGTLRAIGSSGHLAHSNLKPAAVTGFHFTLCLPTPLAYGIWAEVWHGKEFGMARLCFTDSLAP